MPFTLNSTLRCALTALAAAALLSGCAVQTVRPPASSEAQDCLARFEKLDAAIDAAGVHDAEARRIAGFPHLRVDRLLASFRDELADDAARRFWLVQLANLDAAARGPELANLPADARAALGAEAVAPSALDHCRDALIDSDLTDSERFDTLRAAADVPDAYSSARRIAGLYALTRLPFAAGVRAWENQVAEAFAQPLDALPVRGTVTVLAPTAPSSAETPAISTNNELGLPLPDADTLRRLAEHHAPRFEIDIASDADRIGTPAWPPAGPARIDTTNPTLYYRAAHTRVGERILLQLVYTAWFPERPRTGPLDILGGHLDGLVWRVTLAPDGEPLVFDTIHPCGCYHFFFPTARAKPRPAPATLEEWRFVPQSLPRQRPGQQVVLRVESGTHYLRRVRYVPRDTAADVRFTLTPEGALRSLPHPDGGRQSLYGTDGFVVGSERRERFLFWPMGITNPGAMRQWGHHATAFVGRRHFDDPRLIDERFVIID